MDDETSGDLKVGQACYDRHHNRFVKIVEPPISGTYAVQVPGWSAYEQSRSALNPVPDWVFEAHDAGLKDNDAASAQARTKAEANNIGMLASSLMAERAKVARFQPLADFANSLDPGVRITIETASDYYGLAKETGE